MKPLKKFAGRWGPALTVMVVIFWASSTPGGSLPRFGVWDVMLKKGGHAVGYALLGAAYLHGLSAGQAGRPRLRTLALALGLAVAYAGTDELHQVLTPGRNPSLADIAIDAAGAVVGVWVWGRLWSGGVRRRG
jgi:VanZ family protein